MSLTFVRAVPDDDEQLRALLARSPLGGAVRLKIEKEPDYFAASEVEGENEDVLIARRPQDGVIVGVGGRLEKLSHVNGRAEPEWVGYLANLRIEPQYRGGKVLKAGYQVMEKMHREGNAKLYLTTILDDNVVAKRALTSGKFGLPAYRDFGLYNTFVVRTRKALFGSGDIAGITVRQAKQADAPVIVDFWRSQGRRSQFFPGYTVHHLKSDAGLLRGLSVGDLALAFDGDELVGTAGLWDQTGLRQWIIDGYSTSVGLARLPYNVYAALSGKPRLPAGGTALDYRFLSLVCVRDWNPDILRAMLRHLFADREAVGTAGYVIAGFHEKDPLGSVFGSRPNWLFKSRVYIVHWDDGKAAFEALDDSIPYLEVGSL